MMLSDYEIVVLREMERGESDPERIARKTGLPIFIVIAAMERVEGKRLERGKRIEFSRGAVKLLVDVLIAWVALLLIMVVL